HQQIREKDRKGEQEEEIRKRKNYAGRDGGNDDQQKCKNDAARKIVATGGRRDGILERFVDGFARYGRRRFIRLLAHTEGDGLGEAVVFAGFGEWSSKANRSPSLRRFSSGKAKFIPKMTARPSSERRTR